MMDFFKRMYDNFFLLRRAGKQLGFRTGYLPIVVSAAKIAFKEKVNVIGNLDYPNARILMVVDSYRQIRNLRAQKKEPETIAWIENEVMPGDVFYDVGANVGAYSFVAWAHARGKCRVYAFEPSFSTFEALCKNIFLNNASKDITPLQIALGRDTCLTPLNYSDITPGGAAHTFGKAKPSMLCTRSADGEAFSQNVLCYTIDDFVKKFSLPLPNHIKIDVDGYEFDVLCGSEEVFSSANLKSVLIEVDDSLPQNSGVYKFFERKGFSLVSKNKRGDTFNCVFKRVS